MRKIIFLTGGFLCLVLGGIGMFFPILPTTPFVLVAAACFSVSPPIQKRIYKIKFFREYLDSYKKGTPIDTKTRITSISALWVMLIASMIIARKMIMFIILPIVGVAVTIHLLTIGRRKRAKEFSEAQITE
ncbi:MAG: YbaN family protein [Ruminococcus sp.]|jgi:uncharacterized membrane protein YbaN (DUF454 family)|nr:YbaN family protein [Ruminococcus sp.]